MKIKLIILSSLIFLFQFGTVYAMMAPENEDAPDDKVMLSHIATVRELKKQFLQKENEALEKRWNVVLGDKDFDDLKEYLRNTVTGAFLISESSSKGTPISETLKALVKPLLENKDISEDDLYERLSELLRNEIIYSDDYRVLYSSSTGRLAYLYEVMTEFANYFSITPTSELLKFRFSQAEAKPYFGSMEKYVDSFFKLMVGGFGDHTTFARQTLLSANFSFLSFLDHPGESSLAFFLSNVNITDPFADALKSVLWFYLKDEKLVQERYVKYLNLYSEEMSKAGASLIQIFVKKDKIDSLAYLSGPGGFPYIQEKSSLVLANENRWEEMRQFESFDGRLAASTKIIKEVTDIFFEYQSSNSNDDALVELLDFPDALKQIVDAPNQDPFETAMFELTEKLKSIVGANALADDANPYKIYKQRKENKGGPGAALASVDGFISQYLKSTGDAALTPLKAQARVPLKPELLDPQSVKIKAVSLHSLPAETLAVHRSKLAKLVQEDIAYYLRNTQKDESPQNKLEKLKKLIEEGNKFERPLPVAASPEEYNDDVGQTMKVIPKK